jgi:iturin family lipopeptide synthetase A
MPVVEKFFRQVKATPDAVALMHAERKVTYESLGCMVQLLARELSSRGTCPGDVVAVHCGRTVEMVVSMLAVQAVGAAYLPLDPFHPADRLQHLLIDSNSRVLLTKCGLELEKMQERAALVRVDEVISREQAHCTLHEMDLPARGADILYVIYTSGSTGAPKGALVGHDGFDNLMSWYEGELQPTSSDRLLLITSPAFDLTQKNIFLPLVTGGALVLPSVASFDPIAVVKEIETTRSTIINW